MFTITSYPGYQRQKRAEHIESMEDATAIADAIARATSLPAIIENEETGVTWQKWAGTTPSPAAKVAGTSA